MGLSKQCQPGCMAFDGGEVKHRRDCDHYPESLTKLWHDTEAELQSEINRLRATLWSIAHAAGAETKDDLMKAARDALPKSK